MTFTATASPSGATGTAMLTLLDDDISIRTSVATVSVTQGETATYNVQLGEQPPASAVVSVVSQTTANATVSPATLTFSTGNWNMAQTVTVAGVLTGSANIRHAAPASGGFTYVTNDVAVTVTPPAVAAPVFTNAAAFATPIEVEENQSAVRGADYFAASDTNTGNLTLGGADAGRFTLSGSGTLTFNDSPNFEMPRGMAPATGNTNDYVLTVSAMNSTDTTTVNFTVRVTDENDLPVLDAFTLPTFTEYTTGTTITFTATDEDRPAQTLSFSLAANTVGATMTTAGVFTWTPREADGGEARTFTVMVTDNVGSTPVNVNTEFTITANELPNRAPTGATLTVAGGATMVTNPNSLGVSAAATDPDTGDTLTYTWSSSATGDSFSPATGVSTTWTPPTVMAATAVTLTVTVTDSTDGSVTATQSVTVNPMPVQATAPVFTTPPTTALTVADGNVMAGVAGVLAATGTGTVVLTLGGADADFFSISSIGTLTFNTLSNFEMPRGMAPSTTNTNDYALTVTATAGGLSTDLSVTVRVIDANDAPVLNPIPVPPGFKEYSQRGFNIDATDEDIPTQTLTYVLAPNAFGATIESVTIPGLTGSGQFIWTPREEDGGQEREFTVTVTDDGTPPRSDTRTFTITPEELPNRAPTGATITAAAALTSPNTIALEAAATDPDTGTTLTYSWAVTSAEGGTIAPTTGASATYTPPTLAAGDAARMIVITLTVSDGDATMPLTDTATHTITVNPPVPTGTAPAFTNMASFATPISVAENTTAAGIANFFAAPGTGTVNLTLGGTDATRFAITAGGTLTFATAPNFEMPRGMTFDAGTNNNDYALTVTAANAVGSAPSGAITVRVTDVNDAPVLVVIPTPTFTEYTQGEFRINADDEDSPRQGLTFVLAPNAFGATVETRSSNIFGNSGQFIWTPREEDGGQTRMFTVTVTDDGTPPRSDTRDFSLTVGELPNRAPTGAAITIAGGATMVTNPNTLGLSAAATDPDTGDMLTYTWSSDATGGSFSPATGASVTWTPPTVMAATVVVLTVTVTDSTDGSVTATQNVTVNPMPVAPVFTNMTSFATPISVAENTTAAGATNFFAATGTGTVNLMLGGADATRFAITTGGTLTFATAPDFEMPRGMAFNAGNNTNDYALTVTATASGLSGSVNIVVRVTDVNEAPVFAAIVPAAFTEYSPGTFDITATDEDAGQTLSYALTGATHGAALTTTGGTFTWTPGEDDGGMARTFSVTVTDSDATTPMMASTTFVITAVELPNRAPTGVTITAAAMLTYPDTIELVAAATDPDTGDTLTYSWSAGTEGGSITNVVGATATYDAAVQVVQRLRPQYCHYAHRERRQPDRPRPRTRLR